MTDNVTDNMTDSDRRVTLDEVAARASRQAADENFPVAMRVVPARPRGHLLRLYDYARFVDDVGDDAPGDRVALLDIIAEDVRALWSGTPTLPVVAALRPLVDECEVTAEPLLALVAANQQDQVKLRYADRAELMDYCRLSADPIGRVVLAIAGATDPTDATDSDLICSALQVLEHCQDVAEDFRRGRVYLPADELAAAVVTDADLAAGSAGPALRSVIAAQVARSGSELRAGRPLVRRLHGWARVAVAGYVAGGLATIDALQAADYDVLAGPVRPSKVRTARHAARLVVGRHA